MVTSTACWLSLTTLMSYLLPVDEATGLWIWRVEYFVSLMTVLSSLSTRTSRDDSASHGCPELEAPVSWT